MPRKFYFNHEGEEFPRSFYIPNPNSKDEKEVVNKNRQEALMLKVVKELDFFETTMDISNAAMLGAELKPSQVKDAATCEPLIWGNKLTCAEREKVIEISAELWGEDKKIKMANNLMAVFAWESGGTFKTNAPNMSGSGGTGLIQFMPKTAKSLLGKEITIEYVKDYWGRGKSLKRVKEFADMTVLEQLDYVKKHFKPLANKDVEFVDFYLQVLFPVSSGKKEHVVFSKDGKGLDVNDKYFKKRIKAYTQNKGMDADKNGKLMKSEIALAVQKYITKGKSCKNDCTDGSCTLNGEKHDGKIVEDRAPWMGIALSEYDKYGDIKEWKSPLKERIKDYHNTTNSKGLGYSTAWCSSFVNWVMEEANYKGTKSSWSLNWKKWGKEISKPIYGAIAVKTRNGGGHVAFVYAKNGEKGLVLLGGNQGDSLKKSNYKDKSIFTFIVPKDYNITEKDNLENTGRNYEVNNKED